MAFNFGAFAGGLASAIQTQQKLNIEEDQLKATISANQAKLDEQKNKALEQAATLVSNHNNKVNELSLKLKDATDIDTYNTMAKSINDNINSFVQVGTAMAKTAPQGVVDVLKSSTMTPVSEVTNYTIKDVNGKDTNVILPKDIPTEQISNLRLMENGNIGTVTIDEQGKVAGVQPTNIAPIKFKITPEKTAEGIGTLDVVDANGQSKAMTKQAYFALPENERPKLWHPEPNQTKITIEGQKQQTTDEAFNYIENIKKDPKQFNNAVANKLEAQVASTDYGKSDVVKEIRKSAVAQEQSIKSLEMLKNNIQSKVDSKQYENQYKTFANSVITKFVPDSWDTLSPEDKQKSYDWLQTQGAMGDALAKYLKSNSGTAASEKEAIRNMTNMFGTGSEFTNVKAINNSLDGFITTQKNNLINLGNQALDYGLPATGGRIISTYGKEPTAIGSNKSTPKQEAISVPKEIIQNGWIYDAETKKPLRKVQ